MTKPAPPKPTYGAPCNGCGACCRAVPCRMARDLVGAFDAPCPALEHDGARYWCGLVRNPAAARAAGAAAAGAAAGAAGAAAAWAAQSAERAEQERMLRVWLGA